MPDALPPGIRANTELLSLVPCAVLDSDTVIISANKPFAEVWNSTPARMVGEHLAELFMAGDSWTGVQWVTPLQQVALFKTYAEAAKRYGRTGGEVLYYTPNQMVYRGSANLMWDEGREEYTIWMNFNDTVTQHDPHGVHQIWAGDEFVYEAGGHGLSQEDLLLLEKYCKTRSVAELAEQTDMTYKSVEHRLRVLAESHGYSSITEMVKGLAVRVLKRYSRPQNTVRLYANLEELDEIRKKVIPSHQLPPSIRPDRHSDLEKEELARWLVAMGEG